MNKHTKGPWRNEGGDIIGYYTEFADNRIASVNYGHELEKANAHLIAAAPDLLEALENIVNNSIQMAIEHEPYIERAREAIKRARGEE